MQDTHSLEVSTKHSSNEIRRGELKFNSDVLSVNCCESLLSHSPCLLPQSYLLGQVVSGRDERPLLLKVGDSAPSCGSVDGACSRGATHDILAVIHHHRRPDRCFFSPSEKKFKTQSSVVSALLLEGACIVLYRLTNAVITRCSSLMGCPLLCLFLCSRLLFECCDVVVVCLLPGQCVCGNEAAGGGAAVMRRGYRGKETAPENLPWYLRYNRKQ